MFLSVLLLQQELEVRMMLIVAIHVLFRLSDRQLDPPVRDPARAPSSGQL